jgi:hypothetical protein
MNGLVTFKRNEPERRSRSVVGVGLSVTFHIAVILIIAFVGFTDSSSQIVAAGPGEGGEGAGGSIEVGVADASAILGFAKPQVVSFVGSDSNPTNNVRLEAERRDSDNPEEVFRDDREQPDPNALKTNRPVAPQQERIFTGKDERGGSTSQTAQVGRSFGSASPALIGGVGIGHAGGVGAGTGLPGGSEYGRRIQSILSRNYSPPAVEVGGVEYVIIVLRIARDGRIISITNGRVSPAFIKRRSSLAIVNNAAERAVLAANPLPPFPVGFLSGAQEAAAEVWFRYPK